VWCGGTAQGAATPGQQQPAIGHKSSGERPFRQGGSNWSGGVAAVGGHGREIPEGREMGTKGEGGGMGVPHRRPATARCATSTHSSPARGTRATRSVHRAGWRWGCKLRVGRKRGGRGEGRRVGLGGVREAGGRAMARTSPAAGLGHMRTRPAGVARAGAGGSAGGPKAGGEG
jgi:hypothetical protein